MPARPRLPRLRDPLSPLQLLICAVVLVLSDWASRHAGDSFFPGAPLDETAHFLTALLLLQVASATQRERFARPALLASVAIDLDHLPQYFGSDILTAGAPRPYTHSLLTALVLVALALLLGSRRRLYAGLALGVMLHFFRDLGEGNGSGVPLLWPLSSHGYSYPHAAYLAMMAAVVVAGLGRELLRPRAPAELPRRVRRRPASRASA